MNIKEFRGIRSCKKPLGFSDFTILIGRNNSGKSAILEAASLLPLPFELALPYYNDSRVNLLSSLHSGRSSMIYAYSGSACIEYVVQEKVWKIELNKDGRARLFIEGQDPDTIQSNPVLEVVKALRLEISASSMELVNKKVFFIPNDTSFMLSLSTSLIQERNRDLVTKLGAHTRVAKELINECVDDRYTEVLFTPDLSARKELPDGNILYIKIKDLGDGIEKATLVALWLEALKPDLVLWDDFEGSAHPTLIKVLLDWLSKKKWQVILSTHSIDVLNNVLDVRPKNTKVIQLKKSSGDILHHTDLNLEDLQNLIEANQDPRKLVDLLGL